MPDYILGIARGGLIPAVYLSHALNKPLVPLAWNMRDVSPYSNIPNPDIPKDILNGAKFLIMDDIVDGGDTIRSLFKNWDEILRNRGVLPLANVRVGAMWYNTALTDVKVDFYHQTIDRNEDKRWILFEWEVGRI